MAKKKTFVIMYKYANYPWAEYDRTSVEAWKDIQMSRAQIEHEGAEFKVVEK